MLLSVHSCVNSSSYNLHCKQHNIHQSHQQYHHYQQQLSHHVPVLYNPHQLVHHSQFRLNLSQVILHPIDVFFLLAKLSHCICCYLVGLIQLGIRIFKPRNDFVSFFHVLHLDLFRTWWGVWGFGVVDEVVALDCFHLLANGLVFES